MAGFHGYGTTLDLGDAASPEVFTAVAFVVSITPPPLTRVAIDNTHLTSTNAHRERIAGTQDSGPVSMVIQYEPDNATHMNTGSGLIALARSGAIRNWQITLSDTSTNVWGPFPAFVTSFALSDVALDAVVQATVELTLSGEPTAIA